MFFKGTKSISKRKKHSQYLFSRYEVTAKVAAEALWAKRGASVGLLSTHLEIDKGAWVKRTETRIIRVFKKKRHRFCKQLLAWEATLIRRTNTFTRLERLSATKRIVKCSRKRLLRLSDRSVLRGRIICKLVECQVFLCLNCAGKVLCRL